MEEIDLSDKRVSSDDAMREVIQAKARLDAVRKELAAVKRDRDDAYAEYRALQAAKYPVKSTGAKPRKTTGDKIRIIANDVHGSVMDRPAVEAFLSDLRAWNPDEVVLNGDIIEAGGFLSAHHALGYVSQTSYSFQDDIAAGNWFLDEVQAAAPKAKIHYIFGNHEDRVERWIVDQTMRHQRDSEFLRNLFAIEVLLRLEERGVAFYPRSEVYIPGFPPGWIKLGKVYFVHELGGGKNAARDSVSKTAGNVVYAHTHREDSASVVLPAVGGVCKSWNPGCLCQRQPLWRHSNPTDWSHGYGVQIIEPSGEFLHMNIPIIDGRSLAGNLHGMIRN